MDDDADRVKIIDELTAFRVAPAIISDFQNHLEGILDQEYDTLKASGKFVEAFWKICWSLLLRVPEVDLSTKVDKALIALERCPDELERVIQDARLPGVGGRLKKAWSERSKRNAAGEFELLDDELDLLKKDFGRLEELLQGDQLPESGSNKYILAEARLKREKEAATKFREIKKEYEAISIEPEQKRNDTIRQKIQELEAVFINLAADDGEGKYVKQISNYADCLRDSMRKADVTADRRRMNNAAYNRELGILEEARRIFRSETDPNTVLERICHLLKTYEGNDFIGIINELLIDWVKGGRGLFQKEVDSRHPQQKVEYIQHALVILSGAGDFAPPMVQKDLKPFLEALLAPYEPRAERKVQPQQVEPEPRTFWDKLKSLFTGRKPQ
jgi:hypothetical protein